MKLIGIYIVIFVWLFLGYIGDAIYNGTIIENDFESWRNQKTTFFKSLFTGFIMILAVLITKYDMNLAISYSFMFINRKWGKDYKKINY